MEKQRSIAWTAIGLSAIFYSFYHLWTFFSYESEELSTLIMGILWLFSGVAIVRYKKWGLVLMAGLVAYDYRAVVIFWIFELKIKALDLFNNIAYRK